MSDIVNRLRFDFRDRDADEVEEMSQEITRLRADLAQRTAERDEARREICEREARENWIVGESPDGVVINTPEREARLRGWDCFDLIDEKEAKP
jgi:hypothetical protein